MAALSVLPMLALGHYSRGVVPTYVGLFSGPFGIKFGSRGRISAARFKNSLVPAQRPLRLVSRSRSVVTKPVAHQQGNIVSRAGELVNDYSHCKNNSTEGATMGIMADVFQHCFKDECEGMREKVFDQMGSGLAALFRVSMGVAADSTPNKRESYLADMITVEDLEQVRRMLQLTSLPFHNTYDDDLQRLTNMLRKRRLTGHELSQICERLGSDLVQCLVPLALCFPELPLYAKQRALSMPVEVAGKMALSLIAGPSRR